MSDIIVETVHQRERDLGNYIGGHWQPSSNNCRDGHRYGNASPYIEPPASRNRNPPGGLLGNMLAWRAIVQSRVGVIHSDSDDHYNGGPMSLDPQWHVKEPWRR